MTYAYTGKILWVDLSSNKFTEENVPEDIYRKYLGGYGLGVYYIYKNIQPDCDPMGPENILGFVPGALTGSPAPLTGRFMVCGKSPLTGKGLRSDGTMSKGGWGDSNCGGFFGPAIRRSGYDAIFIKGQSEKPVYLVIDDNRKELVPAGELWGIDAVETEKKLKESLGKGYQVSCIGQAGENKSLIAGIVNDGGRIAARSGLGAVMGSKKLKAIALKGKTKVEFADRKALNEIIKPYNKRIKKLMKPGIVTGIVKQVEKMGGIMRKIGMKLEANIPIADRVMVQMYGTAALGTPSTTWVSVETGDAPIKNFKGVGYKDYPKKQAWNVSGNKARTYMKKQYGCFGCPVRCGAILKYDDLEYEDKETHRPEYETMAAFGSMLLNPDLGTVIKCNEFLNRAGMDTISAGVTVSYVMECVEKGLLTKDDFKCKDFPDGFLPKWGESEYILPLLKLMVSREGIGDLLADGTKVATDQIKDSKEYAMNVNGQEIPMHDPRSLPGLGLTYLSDPTPGRHTAASIDFEQVGPSNYFCKQIKFKNSKNPLKKAKAQAKIAKFVQSFNSLGFCMFSMFYGKYPILELFKPTFGWDVTIEEFQKTGHRIQTLRQMFNAREGAIRNEFPKRAAGIPALTKGPLKGKILDLDTLSASYFQNMGFNEAGIPKEETLRKLGLDFCIPDLKKAYGIN